MKGYKGMDKNMQCRGKQYAIGETYIEEKADLCNVGMHYCELPHDVFGYYSPGFSRYFEVEAEDVSNKKDNDSKRVCKRLKIGAEISATVICKIAVKAFFEKFEFDKKIEEAKKSDKTSAGNRGAASAGEYGAASAGNGGAASAGEYGAASAGNRGAASAGYGGAASAGNRGAASAGEYGAASAGEYGAASAGYGGAASAGYGGAASAGEYGAASAGEYGAASAGNRGAASAGEYGAALVMKNGQAEVGLNGVAVAEHNGRVKGDIGAVLVLIERDENGKPNVKVRVVDGQKIKANTWYLIKNGRVQEG